MHHFASQFRPILAGESAIGFQHAVSLDRDLGAEIAEFLSHGLGSLCRTENVGAQIVTRDLALSGGFNREAMVGSNGAFELGPLPHHCGRDVDRFGESDLGAHEVDCTKDCRLVHGDTIAPLSVARNSIVNRFVARGADSIATMPKRLQPTKESMVIAAAIADSGMTKAAIAKRLGIEASNVSFWATARRPVPAALAVPLAEILGLKPQAVSAAYAKVAAGQSARVSEPTGAYGEAIRPDLEVARLQNDVHALNLALGALVVAMARHRPAEAKDVAAAMRKAIPRKFRDAGLVHELLTTLDQA